MLSTFMKDWRFRSSPNKPLDSYFVSHLLSMQSISFIVEQAGNPRKYCEHRPKSFSDRFAERIDRQIEA